MIFPDALLLFAAAAAQATAPVPAAHEEYRSLFTRWSNASGEASERERAALSRVQAEIAAADAARRAQMGLRGRELGERVGAIVRLGDCEGGERMAREAGDIALVEAVRAHCRAVTQPG